MAQNTQSGRPRKRFWRTTRKRVERYLEEYRAGVHIGGRKDGQELTEKEKGNILGYLQCLSDQAGAYKYNKAKKAGATKDEAAEYSRIIGKGGEEILEKAKKRKKK